MVPEIIVQYSGHIVIQTERDTEDESPTGLLTERGFIYELGTSFRYPEQALLSIFAHLSYYENPKIQIPDDEIQRIIDLPIRTTGSKSKS